MKLRKKISIKGVIIGAIVDVGGSNIMGGALGIYLFAKYNLQALPVSERVTQFQFLLQHDALAVILGTVLGSAFSVLGGYVAARIAKHDELLNGTLASFLCVLSALLSIGSVSILWVVLGVVLNPILGFVGGYLYVLQKQHRVLN